MRQPGLLLQPRWARLLRARATSDARPAEQRLGVTRAGHTSRVEGPTLGPAQPLCYQTKSENKLKCDDCRLN